MNGQPAHDNEIDVDTVASAVEDIDIIDLDYTDSDTTYSEPNQERSVAQKDIESLQTIITNEQNLEIIKSKLVATYNLRCEILNNPEISLRLEFPYFFTCPDLVKLKFNH